MQNSWWLSPVRVLTSMNRVESSTTVCGHAVSVCGAAATGPNRDSQSATSCPDATVVGARRSPPSSSQAPRRTRSAVSV